LDDQIIFKFILTVWESEAAKFDSWVLLSTKPILETPDMEEYNYLPFPITY
jgi:hypothetical protein